MKMKMKCNRDCFHCIYSDCIVNNMTESEREASRERDKKFSNCKSNSSIAKARPTRRKRVRSY